MIPNLAELTLEGKPQKPCRIPNWTKDEAKACTVITKSISLKRSLAARKHTARYIYIDDRFKEDSLPILRPGAVDIWLPTTRNIRDGGYPWLTHKLNKWGFTFVHPLALLEILHQFPKIFPGESINTFWQEPKDALWSFTGNENVHWHLHADLYNNQLCVGLESYANFSQLLMRYDGHDCRMAVTKTIGT